MGVAVHRLRQLIHLLEHDAALYGTVAPVYPGHGRPLVEHRELLVYFLQLGLNLLLQVVAMLVGDAVNRAEDQTLVVLPHPWLCTCRRCECYRQYYY